MKKIYSSLKAFALAAVMLAAGSASAQITSIPYTQDFEDGTTAPFVGAAMVKGNDSATKACGAVNGEATADFSIDGGAYTIGSEEEVTVSFQMFNGWLGNGKDDKVAILNSDGVELASISYNENNCNISNVGIGGTTAEGFAAFGGQSMMTNGKGANGWDKNAYIGNEGYNAIVTMKIKGNGNVSVNVSFPQRSIDNTYKGKVEGKMDLAKIVLTCPNGNENRASYIDNLSITSHNSILYTNNYEGEEITWKSATGGRYTPVLLEDAGNKYLSVADGERNNNGTTLSSTETEGLVAEGGNFTMSMRVKLGASTNQAATAFNIYDAANSAKILSLAEVVTNATEWTINGGTQKAAVSAGGGKAIADLSWVNIVLTYNEGLTYLTLKDEAGEIISGFDKTAIPTSTTVGGLGKMEFVTSRYNANFAIDDVVVRDVDVDTDVPATPRYEYTIKFVDQDGVEFADAITREDFDGTAIVLEDADKATVTNGKTQYTYVSDDSEDKVVTADGTVVTVTFNKTSVADYIVKFVDAEGNELKETVTHKNAKVGNEVSATVAEKATILIENTLYEYASGDNALTIAEDETQNVITLTFAAVEGVKAYYYENYESGTNADWTVAAGGRYDAVNVNGASIKARVEDIMEEQEVEVEDKDEEGNVTGTHTEMKPVKVGEKEVPFGNTTRFLTVNQANRNNNGTTLTGKSISVDAADFTLEAKFILGSSNNQNGTNLVINNQANNNPILKLQQKAENSTTEWAINNATEYVTLPRTGTYGGTNNDNLNNYDWYTLKLTVYKGLTYLSIPEAGINMQQINTLAETFGVGNIVFATSRYNANFAIDDILIRDVKEGDYPSGLELAKVTYNFVDEEGNAVKEPAVIEMEANKTIEIADMYKEAFKLTETNEEGVEVPTAKYIYVSDNTEGMIAADGAQVNITFRKAESGRLVVRYKTIIDGVATNTNVAILDTKETGDKLFEGDKIMIYTPLYVWINGADGKGAEPILFKGPKDTYEFRFEFEVPALKTTGSTVVYPDELTVAPATVEETDEEGNVISTIVFFTETEDLEGITVINDNYTQIRQSNGKTGSAIGGPVKVTTLEPGIYTITSSTRSGKTDFTINDQVVYSIETGGAVTTTTSEPITVSKAADLFIAEQAATTQYNDYIIIKKVGDVEKEADGEYAGVIEQTIYDPTQTSVMFPAAGTSEQTVTITPAGEGFVNVTFSGFTVPFPPASLPAFTIENVAVTEKDGVKTYSIGTIVVPIVNSNGATVKYNTTLEGMQTGDETPVFKLVLQANVADVIYFAADKDAIDAYKVAVGINDATTSAPKANGKYLENGKVVIINNGVKFNANGAIVK